MPDQDPNTVSKVPTKTIPKPRNPISLEGLEDLENKTILDKIQEIDIERKQRFGALKTHFAPNTGGFFRRKKIKVPGFNVNITMNVSEQRFRIFGPQENVAVFGGFLEAIAVETKKLNKHDYEFSKGGIHISARFLRVLLDKKLLPEVTEDFKTQLDEVAELETQRIKALYYDKIIERNTEIGKRDKTDTESQRAEEAERLREYRGLKFISRAKKEQVEEGGHLKAKGEWHFECDIQGTVYTDHENMRKLRSNDHYALTTPSLYNTGTGVALHNPTQGSPASRKRVGGKTDPINANLFDGWDELHNHGSGGEYNGQADVDGNIPIDTAPSPTTTVETSDPADINPVDAPNAVVEPINSPNAVDSGTTGENGLDGTEKGSDSALPIGPIAYIILMYGLKGALQAVRDGEDDFKKKVRAKIKNIAEDKLERLKGIEESVKSGSMSSEDAEEEMQEICKDVWRQLNKHERKLYCKGYLSLLDGDRLEKDAITGMLGGVILHVGSDIFKLLPEYMRFDAIGAYEEFSALSISHFLSVYGTEVATVGSFMAIVMGFVKLRELQNETQGFKKKKRLAKFLKKKQPGESRPLDLGFTLEDKHLEDVKAFLHSKKKGKEAEMWALLLLVMGQSGMEAAYILSLVQSQGATAGLGAFGADFIEKSFESTAVQATRAGGAYVTIAAALEISYIAEMAWPSMFPEANKAHRDKILEILKDEGLTIQQKVDAAKELAEKEAIPQLLHANLYSYIESMFIEVKNPRLTAEKEAATSGLYKRWIGFRKGFGYASRSAYNVLFEHRRTKLNRAKRLFSEHLTDKGIGEKEFEELVGLIAENFYEGKLKKGAPMPWYRWTGHKSSYFGENGSFAPVRTSFKKDKNSEDEHPEVNERYKEFIRELLFKYRSGRLDALKFARTHVEPKEQQEESEDNISVEVTNTGERTEAQKLRDEYNAMSEEDQRKLQEVFMDRRYERRWHIEKRAGDGELIKESKIQKVRKVKVPLSIPIAFALLIPLGMLSVAFPPTWPLFIVVALCGFAPEFFIGGAMYYGIAPAANWIARTLFRQKQYEFKGVWFHTIRERLTRDFAIPTISYKWWKLESKQVRIPRWKRFMSQPYHLYFPNPKTVTPSFRKSKSAWRIDFNGFLDKLDGNPEDAKLKAIAEDMNSAMSLINGKYEGKERKGYFQEAYCGVTLKLMDDKINDGTLPDDSFDKNYPKTFTKAAALKKRTGLSYFLIPLKKAALFVAPSLSRRALLSKEERKDMTTLKYYAFEEARKIEKIAEPTNDLKVEKTTVLVEDNNLRTSGTIFDEPEESREVTVSEGNDTAAPTRLLSDIVSEASNVSIEEDNAAKEGIQDHLKGAIKTVRTRNNLAREKIAIKAKNYIDKINIDWREKEDLKKRVTDFVKKPTKTSRRKLQRKIQGISNTTARELQPLTALINNINDKKPEQTYETLKNGYITLSDHWECAVPWAVTDAQLETFFTEKKRNNKFATDIQAKAEDYLGDGGAEEQRKARSKGRLEVLMERCIHKKCGREGLTDTFIARKYESQGKFSRFAKAQNRASNDADMSEEDNDADMSKADIRKLIELELKRNIQQEIVGKLENLRYLVTADTHEEDQVGLKQLEEQLALECKILKDVEKELGTLKTKTGQPTDACVKRTEKLFNITLTKPKPTEEENAVTRNRTRRSFLRPFYRTRSRRPSQRVSV